jgi:hypothetical protein
VCYRKFAQAGAGGRANREQFLLFGAATLNLLYVCVLIHDSFRKVSARPCDRARHFTPTLHLHTTLRGDHLAVISDVPLVALLGGGVDVVCATTAGELIEAATATQGITAVAAVQIICARAAI